MTLLGWSVIAASGLLFGQVQIPGPDPEEKKRGEKMISQAETGIALNEKIAALNEQMISQQRTSNRHQRIGIVIAVIALIVSFFAFFRPH
jgi:hypothetical protein